MKVKRNTEVCLLDICSHVGRIIHRVEAKGNVHLACRPVSETSTINKLLENDLAERSLIVFCCCLFLCSRFI